MANKSKNKQSKSKRQALHYNDFIIEEAEIDDTEEESEEEFDDTEDEIQDFNYKTETSRSDPFASRFEDLYTDAGRREVEDYYSRLYSNRIKDKFGHGDEMTQEIVQQKLLPTVKDPNLWLLKCRIGEERSTALQLMRKFIALQNTDNGLLIKSVITRDSLKGYIYIEAYKQAHAKQAVEGVSSLRASKTAQMVPGLEMPDVLKIVRDNQLKPGTWVRIRSGLYKDDLAKVAEVRQADNQVVLLLVPRIDTTNLNRRRVNNGESKRRPSQARFSAQLIRELGGAVGKSEEYYVYENSRYTTSGFLVKVFQLSAIISGGVVPSPDELARFDESIEQTIDENKFTEGDLVVAIKGDLYGLEGRVRSIRDQTVILEAKHTELNDKIVEVHFSELSKLIKIGDSVKVTGGNFEGDTGIVLFVDGKKVFVLSDSTQQEFEVSINNITLSTDTNGLQSIGAFKIGDLVQIDPQVVGVIIRLERQNLVILNQFGKTIKKNHNSVTPKRVGDNAVTLDSDNQPISITSSVKVVKGPLESETGTVSFIYKNFVFVKSSNLRHNSGTFVVTGRNLLRMGVTDQQRPDRKLDTYLTSPVASPMHYAQSPARTTPSAQRSVRDRRIIGNAVMITKGPLKGNIGIIKDATHSTAQVELHCHCRTINFDRANLTAIRPGQDSSYDLCGDSKPEPERKQPVPLAGRTPAYPQTPMIEGDGGMTPRINPLSDDILPNSVSEYSQPSPASFGRINWQSPLDANLFGTDSPLTPYSSQHYYSDTGDNN